MHEILLQNVLNIPKYCTGFRILELFLNKGETAVMLESADDCNTVIIWAGDKGMSWPIVGYPQRLTSRLVFWY